MQIAICDDIQKELETIRAALDTYAEAHPEFFVRKISGNTLEMFNGVQISIPRRGSEEVQKTYMNFCRREALK